MVAVQHIAFNCSDLKKQEAFYAKHFGFRRGRVFNEGKPTEFVMLRLGNICLELFSSGPEAIAGRGGEQPVGFKHMAFEVDDLGKTIAGLKAEGIEPEDIIDLSHMAEGLRVCFFYDPDGNRLELIEGYQDESPE